MGRDCGRKIGETMDFLNSFLAFPVEQLPYVFIALVIAFTLHEFAHAYSAYLFGDPTAKNQGRVTLDPRAHLDVLGTILIFIAGFGWARPVPVQRNNFKNPKMMGIIVSAAGPLSNLFIAVVGLFLFYTFIQFGLFENLSLGVRTAWGHFFNILISLNILLFIFNLIPLPPLDGYRIIEDVAPLHIKLRMAELEKWSIVIFLLIVFIPPIRAVTLTPILSLTGHVFEGINRMMSVIFGFNILS